MVLRSAGKVRMMAWALFDIELRRKWPVPYESCSTTFNHSNGFAAAIVSGHLPVLATIFARLGIHVSALCHPYSTRFLSLFRTGLQLGKSQH